MPVTFGGIGSQKNNNRLTPKIMLNIGSHSWRNRWDQAKPSSRMIFTVRFVMGVSFAKDSTEEVFFCRGIREVFV
jgi:hypothetical protein